MRRSGSNHNLPLGKKLQMHNGCAPRVYPRTKRSCRHGLSYTTFALSNLEVSSQDVQLIVRNCGNRDGAEIVQVYVAPVNSATCRPVKELKAFTKVVLAPGEAKKVKMNLDRNATNYWSETLDAWVSEKGEYDIFIGTSSDRIILNARFSLEGTEVWRGLWLGG